MNTEEVTELGPRATSLMFQILDHNRESAAYTANWLQEADSRRIAELEAENATLRRELAMVRKNIMRLAYPLDEYGENE